MITKNPQLVSTRKEIITSRSFQFLNIEQIAIQIGSSAMQPPKTDYLISVKNECSKI